MRRVGLTIALAVVPIMLIAECAGADVIRLKSGRTVEGTVIDRNDRQVMVDVPDLGKMSVPWERIASIEVTPPLRPPQLPIPQPASPRWEELKERLDELTARLAALHEKLSLFRFRRPSAIPIEPIVREAVENAVGAAQRVSPQQIPWVVGAALLVYVYGMLCLHRIARNTGTRHRWTAWIPVLQALLVFRVAGRSILWLVPLGLLFVYDPAWGVSAAVALAVVLCVSVGWARGKPIWIGLLLCVPGVNLAALGYLAFSR